MEFKDGTEVGNDIFTSIVHRCRYKVAKEEFTCDCNASKLCITIMMQIIGGERKDSLNTPATL